MRTEKRFYITDTGLGLDTESDEMYGFGDEEDFCRLFDKLNEQEVTINKLKEENEQLQIENKRLREELNDCEKFRYTVFKGMEELIDKGVE